MTDVITISSIISFIIILVIVKIRDYKKIKELDEVSTILMSMLEDVYNIGQVQELFNTKYTELKIKGML